ncbi:MAG: hypothetical protein JXN62_06890 [Bacteroidales bacterium]|nr:hypothetical protein [Bacteroidales bacterium]
MIRKLSFLMLLLNFALSSDLLPQNSQVLYYMNLPQNHFMNPALRPSNRVYIGLPGISGVNLNINNNLLNFKDVFIEGQAIDSMAFLSENFDYDSFISERSDYNFLKPEAAVQIFGLGFSAGKDLYVFMDYNVRVESNFIFPKDIFNLAFYEKNSLAGKTYNLSSLGAGVLAYSEIGLGFSKNIGDRLRIGVKGKMLMGIAAVRLNTDVFSATIGTDYSQSWNADLMLDMSAPATISWDEDNMPSDLVFDESRFETPGNITKSVLNTGNKGFGFDIGLVYNITDKFSVSAALTDLGFINWEKDISNVRGTSQFETSGENIQDVYDGSMDFNEIAEIFLDSLFNSIDFTETHNSFKTKLPYTINAGFSYSPVKQITLGLLSTTRYIDERYKEALTLSANVNLGSLFSTSIAWTATNYRRDNLGLGLAFRAGWFQIYAMADRIPLSFKDVLSDGSDKIPVPEIWSTVHARLGMNICFGNKAVSRKNDKPMIQVQ